MKNKFFFLNLLLILLFSCNSKYKKSNQKKYSYSLSLKDSIQFAVPLNSYYFSRNNKVVQFDDTTFLYRENFLNHGLNIINWNTKKLQGLSYKTEGINAIKSINGAMFYPLYKDSILFVTGIGEVSVLKGNKKVKSFKFNDKNFYANFYEVNFSKSNKINNSHFIISLGSPYRIENKKYYTRKILYRLNIDSINNSNTLNISYPEHIKNDCWTRSNLRFDSTVNNRNQLVVSFSNSDSLYIYDINNKKTKAIQVKSQSVNKIIPYSSCDFENREKLNYYNTHVAQYISIIYNEYKDIYYRIVILPCETEKPKRGLFQENPFSIIVLDNKFNILTERKFTAKKYLILDSFVTKEGLWISTNNPQNKKFDENYLKFHLFNLIKND